MKKPHLALLALWAAVILGISLSGIPSFAEDSNTANYPWNSPWKLVWADEFNGPKGSTPDKAKWSYDIGGGFWGNNELEWYTNKPANVNIENGNLVLRARDEEFAGYPYTSGRLKTRLKFETTYGRFEGRIKIPYGQGIWPAFWMLGNTVGTVTWPLCGEIDIMENIGKEPSTVHGTVHGPGYSGNKGIGRPFTLANNRRFAEDFHIFAIEWEPNLIRWYVDGTLYHTLTSADIPQGTNWVYDHPFYLILNLAVGGGWPGYPDATTKFPQSMLVDYVRVYQRG
ncbi:MAG TPA: glycoside hydrolase family 16 protein [Bacillota bacterium]|nr:glycoside hydrolase family 16 protein [Bacillota bacterium]